MSRAVIEVFEEAEPGDMTKQRTARIVGCEDAQLSGEGATPALALFDLGEALTLKHLGGAALIRSVRTEDAEMRGRGDTGTRG